jgi:hypothetical protein
VLPDLQLRHLPGAHRRRFHIDGGRSWTFRSGTSGDPPSTFSRWQWALSDLQLRHLPGAHRRLPSKKIKITERGAKKLAPPAGSQPLPRWARGATVGTFKTRYPRRQALSQGKEQGVYPRTATQAVAPGLASLLRWASTLPRVLRLQLQLPLPIPRQLRGRHVSCGSVSRCQPGAALGPPRVLWLLLPLPSPGQLRGRHVCLEGPTVCVPLK